MLSIYKRRYERLTMKTIASLFTLDSVAYSLDRYRTWMTTWARPLRRCSALGMSASTRWIGKRRLLVYQGCPQFVIAV